MLTTVQDLVDVVVAAVDYKGETPEIGGISGNTFTSSTFLKLAESVCGYITIETVTKAQLQDASFDTSWLPQADHPVITPEMRAAFEKELSAGVLLTALNGAFGVSDEWNQLLPDLHMTKAEDFLSYIWSGK